MKNRFVILTSLCAVLIIGTETAGALERTGVVVTTMNAGSYTYLEVETKSGRYWAATPQMDLAVGNQVDVAPGSEMKDFYSPTLKRTFDSIIFTPSVKVIGNDPSPDKGGRSKPPGAQTQSGSKEVKTVEQVYADRETLKGKQVQVRGKVVKFNPGIMGKNFLHIQDGSGKEGTNDLAVTSQQDVKVGDHVLVSGTLDTDKDLGAGYTYKAILENASIKVE
ncbi:MAG TPA: DNA-binding protein [Nitrospiria bacterium]|nr:DNA-binding protein [Nitrospiria bacterium]